MDFLTEDMLKFIPAMMCIIVLIIGGGIYLLVRWIKKK